jgi:hypothetical protein
MIQKAMDYFYEMTKARMVAIEGRNYSDKKIYSVDPPSPRNIDVQTLSGFAEYIMAGIDNQVHKALLIHVVDFQTVKLLSNLQNPWLNRILYMTAQSEPPKFPFGQYIDLESFIIRIQSNFVQDDETAKILRVIGNISESAVKSYADDGVSQQVTAKAGISRVADVVVPNPVMLKPFRTFNEIQQPPSEFVLRLRSAKDGDMPQVALFEADGGAWKNEAVKRIGEWISFRTEGKVLIIA